LGAGNDVAVTPTARRIACSSCAATGGYDRSNVTLTSPWRCCRQSGANSRKFLKGKDLRVWELGFEPRMVVFRWHSPRIALTSLAIETPKVETKSHFDNIARMLCSLRQYCPQFAPIFPLKSRQQVSGMLDSLGAE
jgi:hypothetical protein